MAVSIQQEKRSLYEIVDATIEGIDDRHAARAALLQEMHNNRDLWVLTAEWAAGELVQEAIRRTRAQFAQRSWVTERGETCARQDPRQLKHNRTRHLSWLDHYRLSNGRRLGDATRTDLTVEAGMHNRMAQSNTFKMRFYTAIAESMNSDTLKVRDIHSEDSIAELWGEGAV